MSLAASSFGVPNGLLATRAAAQLNPKPHQGFSSKNPAPHPALDDANSTVAMGLRASVLLNRTRQSERARYYGGALGRWTSPDWSEKPDPVPYAELSDPQSLNLYTYISNNPLSSVDEDGHATVCAPDTATWGPDGVTVSSGACHWEPDWWVDLKQWRQRQADDWAKRSNDVRQRLKPMPPNDGLTAEEILNAALSIGTLPAEFGPKPKLESNPKHNPNSPSPEPSNVKELYDKSIEDNRGVRWAKDPDGTIHRFSRPSNGETHWNGSTAGSKPIRTEDIPIEVRRALK